MGDSEPGLTSTNLRKKIAEIRIGSDVSFFWEMLALNFNTNKKSAVALYKVARF